MASPSEVIGHRSNIMAPDSDGELNDDLTNKVPPKLNEDKSGAEWNERDERGTRVQGGIYAPLPHTQKGCRKPASLRSGSGA